MPRSARLDAPGVLHHIMIRGIERRKIFLNRKDYEDFLERLAQLLPQTKTGCYAWVLIPNHAHFLFRTGALPLASLMRRLLTGYAVGFNRRHKRAGQLFQNRYKSIVCQEEAYLGDSGFVDSVLTQAKEEYERRYELKRRGYDLDRIADRVGEIFGMERGEVFSKGQHKRKVKARSLLCYWAAREAGIPLRTLARRLGSSAPAVGYAVERGEGIVRGNQFELIE
jgi:REP element-mobilizing transposase RayT